MFRGGNGTASQERAGEIANGRYNYSEMVAAIPEAVVGCLIAEDLGEWVSCGWGGGERGVTSIKPTTIDKLGILRKGQR